MTYDMRILFLGFFTLILFVPHIVNAQFSSDNFENDMTDSLSKTGNKIIKIATEMAELMIEGEFTDEEIDEALRKFHSPVTQEITVEKLKEMGHDYNGEFITAYNNKMKEEKEKEAKKKPSQFDINREKQETKMRDLDNKLDLNGSELYALHSFDSLDDLLTIENREDLNRIFMQNSINLNDNSNYPYDDYDHINNYDEYKDYTTIK
jgi:hypothetical protein